MMPGLVNMKNDYGCFEHSDWLFKFVDQSERSKPGGDSVVNKMFFV